ncbi:cytidine deaminase [Tissierella praeacuta DSM 18095]|uniref:Cytidine deaminase n=1 Tax=Tissierella praeacuta DSM 18095 TaxID=1123404 RepID=A0A1M4S906_9FIRM|nr:cytidine deaminase [Tissierella praeacuta]SHE28686.1 cytidine deaminase [Tissierella praeacuta DSM 18095]SUP01137.1 Cytidine deaminase [Tissierella praeacuta]
MDIKRLIRKALEAQKKAYVPYSNFHVGAALITEDGEVFTGCNIEISSYSPTLCAERTAIFKAVSEGHKKIKAIAIVGDANFTYPCGVCRQVIREFGKDAIIIIANSEDEYREYKLDELLPHSFGPEDLEDGNTRGGENV